MLDGLAGLVLDGLEITAYIENRRYLLSVSVNSLVNASNNVTQSCKIGIGKIVKTHDKLYHE